MKFRVTKTEEYLVFNKRSQKISRPSAAHASGGACGGLCTPNNTYVSYRSLFFNGFVHKSPAIHYTRKFNLQNKPSLSRVIERKDVMFLLDSRFFYGDGTKSGEPDAAISKTTCGGGVRASSPTCSGATHKNRQKRCAPSLRLSSFVVVCCVSRVAPVFLASVASCSQKHKIC